MRRVLSLGVAACLVMGAATDTPPAARAPGPRMVQQVAPELAEPVLGHAVTGADGKELGRLVDILVTSDGSPQAAIIDFGGFLGVGNRRVAVRWDTLRFAPADLQRAIVLDMTMDEIKAAPAYGSPSKPIQVVTPDPEPSPDVAAKRESGTAATIPGAPAPASATNPPGSEAPSPTTASSPSAATPAPSGTANPATPLAAPPSPAAPAGAAAPAAPLATPPSPAAPAGAAAPAALLATPPSSAAPAGAAAPAAPPATPPSSAAPAGAAAPASAATAPASTTPTAPAQSPALPTADAPPGDAGAPTATRPAEPATSPTVR